MIPYIRGVYMISFVYCSMIDTYLCYFIYVLHIFKDDMMLSISFVTGYNVCMCYSVIIM